MDDVQTQVEAEVENTFINKLLGEMKNKFNKTDVVKESNIDISEDESVSSHEYSSNSSIEHIQDEDIQKVNNTDAKVETDTETNNFVLALKTDDDTMKDTSDNLTTTFRKPHNSLKVKTKTSDSNSDNVRKPLRAKVQIVEDSVVLKRSPRRRSRDYNESILQSAIARKEKSYNEGSRPQRLTRLLKPTPKILENLANAAALKLERNRRDKTKVTDDFGLGSNSGSDSECEERKPKRPKYKHGKSSKQNGKRSFSKDFDCDQSSSQETEESDKCNNKSDHKLQRRSSRLTSRELPEAGTPEQDDCFPADPESLSMEAELISSQLCLCTRQTQFYASVIDNEMVFCTAMDSVSDKIIGCNNIVNVKEVCLLRSSTRVPYSILCDVHLSRMMRHNCCPRCGLFCTEGEFVQCDSKHQYHRDCQISIGQVECCPHCGSSTPPFDVLITMHFEGKPVFLPLQRANYPPAKMSFTNIKSDNPNRLSLPIIPSESIKLIKSKNENCVKYSVKQLYVALKDANQEQFMDMLGLIDGSISSPLEELDGGTLLHYAAENELLSAIHLLVITGIELNVMDKEQNTALVTATLGFKNSIVKYLIKAGCSTTLKGTDGMTPLHVAAKIGNLSACELLLDATLGINDYINVTDDGGWTPLVWACEHGHFEVAKLLVSRGANVALRDVEQNTALHWAAFSGSEEIAELLLHNKSDINAVNVHGDSTLHISARQDMYNFSLILLTRGAQVDLVNKAGETALDCCQPTSECYTAIFLNVNLSSRDNAHCKTIITNDISRGYETNPIQCSNTLDDDQLLNNFTYIVRNCITTENINIDQKVDSMQYCQCEEKCISFACMCCNTSLQCWYSSDGKLVSNFNYIDPPMIFECSQLCSCNAITCTNRVVQHGITQRFQVFKTEEKGWGVKALRSIPKGTFICEYVGEIISDIEAEKREDDSYMFDLDNKEEDAFCIDAKKYGNFARFINHACEPNLVPVRVFTDHQDLRFPKIALFASKNINSEEELSFDYGEKFWLIKYKSFTCKCGCAGCKYSEEKIKVTIEGYNKRLEEEVAT